MRIAADQSNQPDPKTELELRFGVNYIDLDSVVGDDDAINLLPMAQTRQLLATPIMFRRHRLVIAMVDPNDRAAADQVAAITQRQILIMVCTPTAFERFVTKRERQLAALGHS